MLDTDAADPGGPGQPRGVGPTVENMDIVEVVDIAGGLLALAMALGPLAVLAILIRQ
jgi:hypothetical protein